MWHYESDGGGWGNISQPKTHYITNGEERIDCDSALQARTLAHDMNNRRYRITADHPVLARPDKVVSELELSGYKHELELARYENITVTRIEEPK